MATNRGDGAVRAEAHARLGLRVYSREDIERASELGSPLGSWKLACMLIYDDHDHPDPTRAKRLFLEAIAGGVVQAPYSLGLAIHNRLVPGTSDERDELLARALASGFEPAIRSSVLIGTELLDGVVPPGLTVSPCPPEARLMGALEDGLRLMAIGTFSPSDAVEFIFGEDAGTHPNFAGFANKPGIHRELIEMISDPGVSRRILEEPCSVQFNLGVRFYADNTTGDIVRAAGRSARLLKKIYLDAREHEDRFYRVFVDVGRSILHGSCTRLMWECIQRGKARGFSVEIQASPTDIDLSVIKNGMKFRDVRAFNETFAKNSVGLRAIEEAGEGGVPFVIVVVRSNAEGVIRVFTVVDSFKADDLTSKVIIKSNPGQKGSFCWRCFKFDTAKMCSRCRIARYCCAECQSADWPRHRASCARK
jgi:hypothetical protein